MFGLTDVDEQEHHQDDEEDDCNSLIDTLYKWAAIMAVPIILIIGAMIIMGLLKLCDMLFK